MAKVFGVVAALAFGKTRAHERTAADSAITLRLIDMGELYPFLHNLESLCTLR